MKVKYGSNRYPVKLISVNFHPLEVVSRYRDPQLQMGETKHFQMPMFKHTFRSQYQ